MLCVNGVGVWRGNGSDVLGVLLSLALLRGSIVVVWIIE